MNIPDEAVEAAAAAMWKVSPTGWRGIGEPPPFDQARPSAQKQYRQFARASLESAAPFIAAQSLRDFADKLEYGDPTNAWLYELADEMTSNENVEAK